MELGGRFLEFGHVFPVNIEHKVDLAGAQGRELGGLIFHDHHGDPVGEGELILLPVDRIGIPVFGIFGVGLGVSYLIIGEHVRAGAADVLPFVCSARGLLLFRGLNGVVISPAQAVGPVRAPFLHVHDNGVLVHNFPAVDKVQVEGDVLAGVSQTRHAEDHVVGDELPGLHDSRLFLPVDAFPEMEDDPQRVFLHFPFFQQLAPHHLRRDPGAGVELKFFGAARPFLEIAHEQVLHEETRIVSVFPDPVGVVPGKGVEAGDHVHVPERPAVLRFFGGGWGDKGSERERKDKERRKSGSEKSFFHLRLLTPDW